MHQLARESRLRFLFGQGSLIDVGTMILGTRQQAFFVHDLHLLESGGVAGVFRYGFVHVPHGGRAGAPKKSQNAEFGVAPVPVPEAAPSTESDDSLSAFIVDQHAKGKLKFSTLAALEAKDLETVGKTLDDLIVRVEAKLK